MKLFLKETQIQKRGKEQGFGTERGRVLHGVSWAATEQRSILRRRVGPYRLEG